MEGYTAKEIILSTKDKISEIQEKLKRLRKLTYTDCDKNIKELNYYTLTPTWDNEPELRCVVKWNDRRLKGIINNIKVKFNLYAWGPEGGLVVRDNNGKCYIIHCDYQMGIPDDKQKEFGEITDSILKDDFVRLFLNTQGFYSQEYQNTRRMEVSSRSLYVSGLSENVCFSYKPLEQTATLRTGYGERLSNNQLQLLLNTPFDDIDYIGYGREKTTPYRRDFIASSPQKDKEIFIPQFDVDKKCVEFNVEEDDKGLYLIRK